MNKDINIVKENIKKAIKLIGSKVISPHMPNEQKGLYEALGILDGCLLVRADKTAPDVSWNKGFPNENCMCLVKLKDGEFVVTPYTHTPRRDTWGDLSKTGWSCLTGSRCTVEKWVKVQNIDQALQNQGKAVDVESAIKALHKILDVALEAQSPEGTVEEQEVI